MKTLYK